MKNNLRESRLNSGYSVKKVSSMVNVSSQTLLNYERNPGKTPIDVYYKLTSIYRNPSK